MSNDVDIRIREDGSVVVIRNFDALITASDKAGTAITGLKTTLESLKLISLKVLIDEVKLLATELKTLNSGSTELTALKNAITTLSGSGSSLKTLQGILTGFSNSVTGLGQLHNALQQLSTSGNSFDRLNTHLAALPPLIAHVTALHTALSALVALNPQIAILAAEVRNLAGSTTAIRQFQQSIVALNASMANLVRQSQQIANALNGLGGAARNSSSAFFGLSNTLAGLSLYIVAQKVRDWIDAWASVSGLIHIATESFAEFTLVQEKLFAVTQNIRSPLEETAQLYARINRVSDSLGASQNQSIKFTEGVGKALAIQHSRVGEVTGGLIQLAQALGSGIVRSQEFRSINDSLPVVMRTVAKNMEGGAVSVSQLRRRMLEGNLTSEQFFQAFLRGSNALDKDFKESGYTISQAFSILNNDMIKFIGQLNKASGFSDAFAASLRFLGSNIEILGGIAIFALITWLGGLTIALMASTTAMGLMSSAVALFTRVVLLNPTVFLIASLTTLAFAMYAVKDSMELGTSSLVTFGKKTIEVRATFGDFLKLVVQDTKDYLGAALYVFSDFFSGVNEVTKNATKGGEDKGLFDFEATGIIAKILTVARIFDLAASTIRGVSAMLANTLEFLFGNIGIAIDTVADKFNQFMNKFKKEQTAPLVIPMAMTTEQLAQNIRTDKDQIMKDMVDPQGNSLTAGINRQAELAQKDAVARELALQKALADMDKRGTPDPVNGKVDKGLKTLQSQYEALLNTIDKVSSAQLEVNKGIELLDKLVAKGIITQTKRNELEIKLKAHYEDQLNPLKAANRELERSKQLSALLPEQRAIEAEYLKKIDEYKKSGLITDRDNLGVYKEIFAEYKKRLELQQQQQKVTAISDQVYGDYRKKQRDPLDTEEAYTKLLKNPDAKDPKKAILDNEMTKNPDLFAGTQEAIDAQITAMEMMYSRIDFLRKNDIISEETAKFQRTKIKQQEQQILNKTTEDTFNNLAVLSKSGNRKLAIIGKAAAITMATIKGFEAIQLALATPPGWPYNAPNVASVTIAQAANLASIVGVGFMTGGSFDVAGSGGHDSQTVAFRASPGERVSIQTPQQYRKGDPNGNSSQGQQKQADNNIRIVNVLDPALVGNYLSTREGERLVLNVIEKNSSSVRNFVRES